MTGYQPKYKPYVTRPETDDLIPITDFQVPSLVLYDGHRVGLQDVMGVDATIDPSLHNLVLCKFGAALSHLSIWEL